MNDQKFTLKIANEPWELESVCRLNHQTFSDELQQHEKKETGLLVDKFHLENNYIICLKESEIVGMFAFRDVRPFSLDSKLEKIDDYLPPHTSICEFRLLAIIPKYRGSKVFYYLLKEAFTQVVKNKYDYALLSGILSQQKLYRSIGFVPFGPVVGEEVKFQPMYISTNFFFKSRHKIIASKFQNRRINVLPGPVDIKNIVAEEYKNLPESHRSEEFSGNYQDICQSLCSFVNTKNVQVFTGSATLANEVMLAHISTLSEKGLIISNGEFGNRLIHQAHCQKLIFTEYRVGLNDELETARIEELLQNNPEIKWLFFVHCETSTGVLNDLTEIINVCERRNVLVFVDCVSTFGSIPLDLSKVYMSSASSGKAIGSYSGLSMIFFNSLIEKPENTIPLYLDIFYYIRKRGIPFTLNSNALYALGSAVKIIDIHLKYNTIKEQTLWLRNQIATLCPNLELCEGKLLHPAIITIKLPDSISSLTSGKLFEEKNILINYRSDYLLEHNMIQICLFSETSKEDLQNLVVSLCQVCL